MLVSHNLWSMYGVTNMCNKCTERRKYWLHIADSWTMEEMVEMEEYLHQFTRNR